MFLSMKSKTSACNLFLKYDFKLITITVKLQFRKQRIGWTLPL